MNGLGFSEVQAICVFGLRCLTDQGARNYIVAMRTRIVRIGNSQGVRIPKLLLERSKLADEVELEAQDEQIVIRRAKQPRQDWAEAFRAMSASGADELLDGDLLRQTSWDEREWQW